MKTNIIRLKDCKNSKRYANWCWQTSAINTNVKYFDAVIPDEVDELMSGLRIEWKYPWTGEVNDIKSGLGEMLHFYLVSSKKDYSFFYRKR